MLHYYTSNLHNLFKFLHEKMPRFIPPESGEMSSPQKLFLMYKSWAYKNMNKDICWR